MVIGKQAVPVFFQSRKGFFNIGICLVTIQHSPCTALIDDAVRFPLLIIRILNISQNENERSAFSRFQSDVELMTGNRRPAACNRIGTGTVYNNVRRICTIICAKKSISTGIKAVDLCVYGINSIMIAAFAIFCFVENSRINNFYFTGT